MEPRPESDRPAPAGARMSQAEYGASRAALWTGVSVLFTDEHGRVLLEALDYRDVRLLPGGAVDAGEAPLSAATREMREELALAGSYPQGLAVDWVSRDTVGFDPAMRFPGEIIYVLDGGTLTVGQVGSIRLPGREVTGVHWTEPALLPRYMEPGDARRALSALRARINGTGAALLEGGYPTAPTLLDELQVMRTPREPQRWPWHGEPVTPGLRIAESRGWLFAPDGRVLVLIDRDTGAASLPGAKASPVGQGDPAVALVTTAYEAARISVADPVHLGYLYDATGEGSAGTGPCARVRMATRITACGPVADTPDVRTSARILATPAQVAELSDWGPDGLRQAADAAHAARVQFGLPAPARQPITELPRDGGPL